MSAMAFNPPVPVAKKVQPTARPKQVRFVDTSFQQECDSLRKKQTKSFYIAVSNIKIKD